MPGNDANIAINPDLDENIKAQLREAIDQLRARKENIDARIFPFVLLTAGCMAGITKELMAKPEQTGWSVLLDRTFSANAWVGSLVANLGFAVGCSTIPDIMLNHIKTTIRNRPEFKNVSWDELTNGEFAELLNKSAGKIIMDTLISYTKGTLAFGAFPYIATTAGITATQYIAPQPGVEQTAAKIGADAVTAGVLAVIFDAMHKFKMPWRAIAQLIPGVYGILTAGLIIESVTSENPSMDKNLEFAMKVTLPAAMAALFSTVGLLPNAATNAVTTLRSGISKLASCCYATLFSNADEQKPLLMEPDKYPSINSDPQP